MSWSPELYIGGMRPWPDSVAVVRSQTDERRLYVPETKYQMLHDRYREASTDAERWERVAHDHEGLCKSLKETNADLRRMLKEQTDERRLYVPAGERNISCAESDTDAEGGERRPAETSVVREDRVTSGTRTDAAEDGGRMRLTYDELNEMLDEAEAESCRLRVENAKLRELVRDMYTTISWCDLDTCPTEGKKREYLNRVRELGVEADA